MSLVERGERSPSIDFVEKISAALNVPPDAVFALAVDETDVPDPEHRDLLNKLKALMVLLAQEQS